MRSVGVDASSRGRVRAMAGCSMLLVALGALGGCTTVQGVCEKKIDVVERSLGAYDDPKVKQQMTDKCVVEMQALKTSDPKKWQCESGCYMASKQLSEVEGCMKECR
jgi:hypothetical protein